MEGRKRPEGMTEDQFAEAARLEEVTRDAVADELWRMSCLMAGKKTGEQLGQAEFQLRDIVHRVGAIVLEAAVEERRKKGGIRAAALSARAR
jgi:hypothetical protein